MFGADEWIVATGASGTVHDDPPRRRASSPPQVADQRRRATRRRGGAQPHGHRQGLGQGPQPRRARDRWAGSPRIAEGRDVRAAARWCSARGSSGPSVTDAVDRRQDVPHRREDRRRPLHVRNTHRVRLARRRAAAWCSTGCPLATGGRRPRPRHPTARHEIGRPTAPGRDRPQPPAEVGLQAISITVMAVLMWVIAAGHHRPDRLPLGHRADPRLRHLQGHGRAESRHRRRARCSRP